MLDEKALKELQPPKPAFDFDRYWAETTGEPIKFKVFGEIEEMPPSCPATFMLELLRITREHGDSIPEREILPLCVAIFGQERMERWAQKGMTVVQFKDLFRWALAQYGRGNWATPAEETPAGVTQTPETTNGHT